MRKQAHLLSLTLFLHNSAGQCRIFNPKVMCSYVQVILRQVCQLLKLKVAIEKWFGPFDRTYGFLSPTFQLVLSNEGEMSIA